MLPDLTEDQLINYWAWLLIASGVLLLVYSTFGKLPYGRYATANWGPSIDAKLAWILQELPAFLIPLLLLTRELWNPTFSLFTPNVALTALFLAHYFRRSILYPLRMKMTVATPFLTFFLALCFCSANGYTQIRYLIKFADHYSLTLFYTPRFWAGVSLFFVGFAINVHSDNIVTNLRKPGETGYKIPKGGLYDYISGANYFGEIVEWGGFSLASCSFVSFAFFLFTALALSSRAYHHHRFYQEKFEDYPKSRKAIIPFMF